MYNGGIVGTVNSPSGSSADDSGVWGVNDVFYGIKELGSWGEVPRYFGSIGLFGGGYITAATNVIDYVTISTPSNATDFGDLTVARYGLASCSNGVYGLFGGGYATSNANVIDYVTISTPSNATDFGDLTVARQRLASCSNGVYGLFGGGYATHNIIDYVTISTPSNATDFGDLTVGRNGLASCSGE